MVNQLHSPSFQNLGGATVLQLASNLQSLDSKCRCGQLYCIKILLRNIDKQTIRIVLV